MTHWIVVGAGYTGELLATQLVRLREQVTITRRSQTDLDRQLDRVLGVSGWVVDLADRVTLDHLPTGDAIVVCLAPPGDDPDGEMRTLARAAQHARRIVYVSSTGVYAPGNGAIVDERWPLEPQTESGRKRLLAERALASATRVPLAILRAAGIYGPGRGTEDRLRTGTYRIIGDGSAHVSRIHVEDLVAIIIAAGQQPEITGAINVADDDPSPIGEVADTIAERLGLAPPPRVDPSTVSPEIAGMLLANRRIANGRLEELGITLRYPSWRS